MFIDVDGFIEQQKTYPAPKQGAFNQALGKKTSRIIDATCGWGGDSLLMCAQGYSVSMIERNPLMVLLLKDAMQRLSKTIWASKHSVIIPDVIAANAIDWFSANSSHGECIYLDPMFPLKRKKSAATNKYMQFLQWLVGQDQDADRLLSAAIAHGSGRVAVKRPDYAAPLMQDLLEPDVRFSSKLIHYDVYLAS